MIVKLFCPKCVYEKSKGFDGHATLEVPVPLTRLSDNGEYEVECGKGHISTVILDNVKFELLFEIGLNAIIDGYPREAVSSFASALERFYEFYWRVVMRHHGIDKSDIDSSWKPLSKQSERQMGAYVTAATLLTKNIPNLLNTNKEVPFRNKVIHNGYVPTTEEAIIFGDVVMELINNDLEQLRLITKSALEATYKEQSPRDYESSEEEDDGDDTNIVGCVNILTAIDVRHPPKGKDKRVGSVKDQFNRINDERQPTRMQMLSTEEMKKRFPDREFPETEYAP
jgi:hypothetical protein